MGDVHSASDAGMGLGAVGTEQPLLPALAVSGTELLSFQADWESKCRDLLALICGSGKITFTFCVLVLRATGTGGVSVHVQGAVGL